MRQWMEQRMSLLLVGALSFGTEGEDISEGSQSHLSIIVGGRSGLGLHAG